MSTGDEASRFARFAFRRHFFQHLGFRVAQSVADSPPVRLVETPIFVLGVGVEGEFFVNRRNRDRQYTNCNFTKELF